MPPAKAKIHNGRRRRLRTKPYASTRWTRSVLATESELITSASWRNGQAGSSAALPSQEAAALADRRASLMTLTTRSHAEATAGARRTARAVGFVASRHTLTPKRDIYTAAVAGLLRYDPSKDPPPSAETTRSTTATYPESRRTEAVRRRCSAGGVIGLASSGPRRVPRGGRPT